MSKKRQELKKTFEKVIEILNHITDAKAETKIVRHVDDNLLVLTKEQSQARLNSLLIILSHILVFLTLLLIFLACYFSKEIKSGTYFHESITEEAMRTQKLFLVHSDGRTQKLGLYECFIWNWFIYHLC